MKLRLHFGLLYCALSGSVQAMEYVSLTAPQTIMYDAPSVRAKQLGIVRGAMPCEVIVTISGWLKVRDLNGKLFWLANTSVSKKRMVQAIQSLVDVFELPEFTSRVLFRAQQDVVMEWLDNTGDGWVKVHHADGETGYVRSESVWGE